MTDLAYFVEANKDSLEMDLTKILQEITDNAIEDANLHILDIIINYYEKQQKFPFPDLLQGWADYARIESLKEKQKSTVPAWLSMHNVFSIAASKLENRDDQTTIHPELEVVLKISRYRKRAVILSCISPIMQGLERSQCHLKDLALSLSNYIEFREDMDREEDWKHVADILRAGVRDIDEQLP